MDTGDSTDFFPEFSDFSIENKRISLGFEQQCS